MQKQKDNSVKGKGCLSKGKMVCIWVEREGIRGKANGCMNREMRVFRQKEKRIHVQGK